MILELNNRLKGSILDVGGGGECVIGQLFGSAVIAIDCSQDELDDAPDCCEKRLMDAAELTFPDASFDNVTFFYSLMYMTRDTQQKAVAQAARVLKPGGLLHIWDAKIASAYPDPYIVDLEIHAGDLTIPVTYGIVKAEGQSADAFLQLLNENGLRILQTTSECGQFYIAAEKRR